MFGFKRCLIGDRLDRLYVLKLPFEIDIMEFIAVKRLDSQLLLCVNEGGMDQMFKYTGGSSIILNYSDAISIGDSVGDQSPNVDDLKFWTFQIVSKLIIMEQNNIINGNLLKDSVYIDKSKNVIFRNQFLFHLANYEFPIGYVLLADM